VSAGSLISWLFALPRSYKMGIAVVADIIFCFIAIWLAMILRTESFQISAWQLTVPGVISAVSVIFLMNRFGVYSEITRYSGASTLFSILKAFSIYVPAYFVVVTIITIESVPRSIGLLQPLILIALILNARFVVRGLDRPTARGSKNSHTNIIIYGAGPAGRQIANAIKQTQGVKLVGFFDDDPELKNKRINGIPVMDPADSSGIIAKYDVHEILLSTNSFDATRKGLLVKQTLRSGVPIRIVHSIDKLLSEPLNIEQLKKIEIEDLLGREPVKPDTSQLRENVTNKVVLVSGAGGSIGSELVLQLARLAPRKLILLESSEFALYTVMAKVSKIIGSEDIDVEPVLGSVCDRDAMFELVSSRRPDTVFHAAACKHVHIVEQNPFFGLQTNYFGTQNLADAALASGVAVFLLISSDKAVRPTNVMGATKRLAELYIQSLSQQGATTKFVAVRFGNVLGSSGSVVPAFKAQLQEKGPLKVTHPDMERYFMTIGEAVELVIQTSSIGGSGDLLLLDMGAPIKIDDLARQMIALSGFTLRDKTNPSGQIEIVYVGLRPGEKLYEELLVDGTSTATSHPRIFKADETHGGLQIFINRAETLNDLDCTVDAKKIKDALKSLIPEYEPFVAGG